MLSMDDAGHHMQGVWLITHADLCSRGRVGGSFISEDSTNGSQSTYILLKQAKKHPRSNSKLRQIIRQIIINIEKTTGQEVLRMARCFLCVKLPAVVCLHGSQFPLLLLLNHLPLLLLLNHLGSCLHLMMSTCLLRVNRS